MFNSIINNNIDIKSFTIIMISSIIIGLIISLVHMKGGKYSKNYSITLAVLPSLVSAIIMVVNGSVGTAVAVMGSFSLIRFRSIPGSSREILDIFFTMVMGVILGSGYIVFAYIMCIFVSIILLILNKSKFGEIKGIKSLKILIPEDLDYTNVFNDIFTKYTSSYTLTKTSLTNMGSMFELKYDIILKGNINEKEFIDELRTRNSNLRITLSNIEEETL